jgi:steroid C-25 hydroxylase beta subunit
MSEGANGRQLAMVIDLNKCLGCQTCTIACKTLWTRGRGMEAMWWNIVNTMPGRGTPRDAFQLGGGYRDGEPVPGSLSPGRLYGEAWDFDYDTLFGPAEGPGRLRPLERDGGSPEWGPNWDEDIGGGTYPNSYFFYLPLLCMNCSKPACLEACPRSAVYRRDEDGIVLIDEERCHGYRFCMEACPYKRIYFNEERSIAQKCNSCFPRVEEGIAPACVRQCPGRARHVGYLEDPKAQVSRLVREWRVALPLRPDFEVEPNVYYVPPLSPLGFDDDGAFDEGQPRIPLEYLREMFGPTVDAALATIEAERERVASGGTSELIDVLISPRWLDMLGPLTVDPATVRPDREP